MDASGTGRWEKVWATGPSGVDICHSDNPTLERGRTLRVRRLSDVDIGWEVEKSVFRFWHFLKKVTKNRKVKCAHFAKQHIFRHITRNLGVIFSPRVFFRFSSMYRLWPRNRRKSGFWKSKKCSRTPFRTYSTPPPRALPPPAKSVTQGIV